MAAPSVAVLVVARHGTAGGGAEPPAAREGGRGAGAHQRGSDTEQGWGDAGEGRSGGGRRRSAQVLPAQFGAHGARGAGRRPQGHPNRVVFLVHACCLRHQGRYPAGLSGKDPNQWYFLINLGSDIKGKRGHLWEKKQIFIC